MAKITGKYEVLYIFEPAQGEEILRSVGSKNEKAILSMVDLQ